MADLAAQKLTNDGSGQAELTDADFDDIFNAAKMMIWPLPKDYLHLEIDQIDSHDAVHFVNPGPPRVNWAVTDNATKYRECQYLIPSDNNEYDTIPSGLLKVGYVISARAEYNFGAAVLPRFFAKAMTLTRWSYKLPRTPTGFSQLNNINLKATSARVRSKCTKIYDTPVNSAPTQSQPTDLLGLSGPYAYSPSTMNVYVHGSDGLWHYAGYIQPETYTGSNNFSWTSGARPSN